MQDNKLSIEVVLNIFSGRPNPKWMLSETQASELKEKLAQIPPPLKEPKMPPGLGYRGFIVTNLSETPTIPNQIHIFSGVLTIKDKGTISHHKDISNIEEWLLSQARELGYGNILEEARHIIMNNDEKLPLHESVGTILKIYARYLLIFLGFVIVTLELWVLLVVFQTLSQPIFLTVPIILGTSLLAALPWISFLYRGPYKWLAAFVKKQPEPYLNITWDDMRGDKIRKVIAHGS